ncbi:MAG: 30S ribosomal protein S2 [Chlamydiia bacterium]|nr:30S ribosomal protein S2 [Chlamydiia bacterium]
MAETKEKKERQINVSIKELLEAGVHFGHQTYRWNPKMKRFIYEERNGIHIIDLSKTMYHLRKACDIIAKEVAKGKSVLFVGTKKQAKMVVQDCAEECGEHHVGERWLGGMLTNLSTIRGSIKKLERIEKKLETGAEGLTKKEISLMMKKQVKLNNNLCGIRTMKKVPGVIVVIDPVTEHLAVAEARKLGIPVLAIIDTNGDPDGVDFVIPANDDALKSNKLILGALKDTIIQVKEENGLPLRASEVEKNKKSAKNVAAAKETAPKKAEVKKAEPKKDVKSVDVKGAK